MFFMHIDYALLSEFATLSTNGLHSFMHIFDRTSFQPGAPLGLRAFLGVKLSELPEEGDLEVYVTDSANVVVEKGNLMKGKVKGPSAQIVFRITLPVAKPDTYTIWVRLGGGEPQRLTAWIAEEKA